MCRDRCCLFVPDVVTGNMYVQCTSFYHSPEHAKRQKTKRVMLCIITCPFTLAYNDSAHQNDLHT